MLETESGKPWQEWNLKKNEDGSYCVIPHHAPAKGLDHLGGRPVAGAKIDLWANNPGDRHLEWIIKPLAGTMPRSPPRRRIPIQDVRCARHQTRRHSQRRAEGLHVFEQHDFSGDRPASDGLHPRPVRRIAAGVRLRQD